MFNNESVYMVFFMTAKGFFKNSYNIYKNGLSGEYGSFLG